MSNFSKIGTVTALVLGASRAGAEDAVARLQGKSHKCLVEIDGVVMIERVLRELLNARYVGRVIVSIEAREFLMTVPACHQWLEEGRLQFVESGQNLHLSIAHAADQIADAFPLLITTADNALHTAEMIDHFLEQTFTSGIDAAVAVTDAKLVKKSFPESGLTFHKLRGGAYSSCNLYALTHVGAASAAKAFEGGGQFAKKPLRVVRAFGFATLVLSRLRLLTLDGISARLSRTLGLKLGVIDLPFAEAPIDVDNVRDFALIEKILMARRTTG